MEVPLCARRGCDSVNVRWACSVRLSQWVVFLQKLGSGRNIPACAIVEASTPDSVWMVPVAR